MGDLVVYRSLDPFTFESMKKQRRKKLKEAAKKSGNTQPITEASVCAALVEKSTQSSEAWNKAANAAEKIGAGYFMETLQSYLGPLFAFVAGAHLLQVLIRF